MKKRRGKQRTSKILAREARSTYRDPGEWFVDLATGGRTNASGQTVNQATAMGISTFFACIRNISEDCAKLPLKIYESLEPRGCKALRDHRVYALLHDSPNPAMTAMTFRETLIAHALAYRGGYAEIIRDENGTPVELWPIDPTTISPKMENGELWYEVRQQGLLVYLPSRSVFHIHGLGFDALTGYVITALGKESIGTAIGAQKYSASFFANGTTTTGVIEVPGAMRDTALKHLRDSFAERHGGAYNAHKPIILEDGAKFNPTSSDPEKSQLIQTLQHGVEEICRWFRMPPHKVQHLLRATFSNIEEQNIEYVTDCLMSWLVRFEQEIDRKLLSISERKKLYARHSVNGMLRGDSAKRGAFYTQLVNMGAATPNDICEWEDMPLMGPEGDVHTVNAAVVPLWAVAQGLTLNKLQDTQKPDTSQSEPKDTPPDEGIADEEDGNRFIDIYRPLLASTYQRMNRIYRDRVKPGESNAAFSRSHMIHVTDAITPIVRAFAHSVQAVFSESALMEFVRSLPEPSYTGDIESDANKSADIALNRAYEWAFKETRENA